MKKTVFGFASAGVLLGLLFTGCSDDDDTPGVDGAADAAANLDGGGTAMETGTADVAAKSDMGAFVDGGGGDVALSEKLITAATGGTLDVTGGSIKVPSGVLTSDITLTVSERAPAAGTPNKDDINGLIYDLGPNGTTFKTPIELKLPLTGAVPVGKQAVLAYFETRTGVWKPLSSTVVGTAGNQKVSALVTHFTSFAVLFSSATTVCPVVAACGGSMVGAWEIVGLCSAKPDKPVVVDCKDGTSNNAYAVFDLSGTWTVAADNSYTFAQTIDVSVLSNSAPACIALSNTVLPADQKITACPSLEAGLTKEFSMPSKCLGDVAQTCTCVASKQVVQMETGTVAVTGNTFTTTKTGSTADGTNTFCVKNNVLTVTTAKGDVYTAVKK